MRPSVSFLSQDMIKKIIDQAYDILCRKGVMFENKNAINILAQGGAHVNRDAKLLDTQAGIETGMGATLAALAGINSISGPGMLDFENCFSIEKLVVDNEICAMTFRMLDGIAETEQQSIIPLIDELILEGHLFTSEHTMNFLRSEHHYPDKIIERGNRSRWIREGELTVNQQAEIKVNGLLDSYEAPPLPAESEKEIIKLMKSEAKLYGFEKLPDIKL